METDPFKILQEYACYPSVSTDSSYAEGMLQSRDFATKKLSDLGFEVKIIETDWHPIILAERMAPEGSPHIVVYGHYDVQPADPFEKWVSPPFEPTLRDGRLYGRGTADNKGPTAVQFAAFARVLEKHPDLPLRVTWLIEGEEETGSPSFPKFLDDYGDVLRKADFVVLSDTGIPDHENMVITTGLRGMSAIQIELTGPRTDLHSGVHGGAIMNPIQALTEICASLHDADGRVNVPGFYDDLIEPEDWERDELKRLPVDFDVYKEFLGVPSFFTPPGYNPFEAIRFGSTLEFNGIGGGYQGEGSKTIIPSTAFAKITCRLVPNQDIKKIVKSLEATIRARLPEGVQLRFIDQEGGGPYHVVPPGRPNTPEDQPEALKRGYAAAEKAIAASFGKPALYLREGGSVPIIGQIKEKTGLDSVMIGIFIPQDNLHAPNESFDLAFMERATAMYQRFFSEMAGV